MEIPTVTEPSNGELKVILDQLVKASRDDARATAERFGEVKSALKNVDDRSIETRDIVNRLVGRVDTLERDGDRHKEGVRKAIQSASDLGDRVRSTEDATKRAVDKMGDQIRDVDAKVDRMSAEQTPLLREIREELIAKKERDRLAAEARVDADAKHKRRIAYQRIWVPCLVAAIGLGAAYFGAKQAVTEHSTTSVTTPK